MKIHAHEMVAKLCVDLAQASYEKLAKDNEWYAANPDRRAFVTAFAPKLVGRVRAQLADMLTSRTVSESDKAMIFDALIKDVSIPRGHSSRVH